MNRFLEGLAIAALAAATAAITAGCSTEAYCFQCDVTTTKGGGGGESSSGGGQGGGVNVQGGSAQGGHAGGGIGIGGQTTCTADTKNDPKNCGACGNVCALPNANATCVAGVCTFACQAGHFDHDGDIAKNNSDGCEYACNKTSDKELCNGLDDNCDGQIDEGKVCNDALNCGAFGMACLYSNSNGDCVDGKCVPTDCKPGFHPKAGEPMPNCDYACNTTNGGKEICDGLDNDCDGQIDDDPDTTSDPFHCGACDKNCLTAFDNSTPTCVDSQCVLGECAPGYFDLDGDPSNGCEYTCKDKCNFPFAQPVCSADGKTCTMGACQTGHADLDGDPTNGCECAQTNGGVEACDGLDNDCDGTIDNGFDLDSNPQNCGSCGFDCGPFFPHAVAKCTGGQCAFDHCDAGWVPSGNTAAGCQYMCSPTADPTEICDGIDNDCNGVVDDVPAGTPGIGDACTTGQPGVCANGTHVCQGGKPVCVANVTSSPEVCDGLDNDCDGLVDNPPSGLELDGEGANCGASQLGICKFGTTKCQSGGFVCSGEIDAGTEICNNLDDDCDGKVDDGAAGDASKCTSPNKGICKQGTPTCAGGTTTCVGEIKPQTEVCDTTPTTAGTDENCNGTVDEGCLYIGSNLATRRDTLNSSESQYPTYSLTTTSNVDDFLAAYADDRSGSGDIYVRVSTNAGTSWGTDDIQAVGTGTIEVEPKLFMRAGRAYIAYSNFEGNSVREPYVARAATPYTTWTSVKVGGPVTAGDDCYTPQGVVAKVDTSAAAKDWLAVVYSEIGGTAIKPTRNVRLVYSKDGAATWKGPITVNSHADTAELPVIATDGAGVVVVAWRDKHNAGSATVTAARIDLSATTPAAANETALQPSTASAEDISISSSGSTIDVIWTDLRATRKQIRVGASLNGGTTWTADGTIIEDSAGQQSDAQSPTIQTSGNNVIAAWEDGRSGLTDIRFNKSADGGKTWDGGQNPRLDTGDGLGASASFTPQLAFGKGSLVFATWRDQHFPQAAIIANESIDGGATWHPSAITTFRMDTGNGSSSNFVQNDVADSQTPFVFASTATAQAAVVWIDYVTGTHATGPNGDVYTRLMK